MKTASSEWLTGRVRDSGSGDRRPCPPSISAADTPPAELVPAVVEALRCYPYFVVLRGLASPEDRRVGEEIVTAVALYADRHRPTAGTRPDKISFTRVRIDRETAAREGAVTRYSRTHLALPPHTDSAYSDRPHALVAFHMVRRDPLGGLSTVVPVADIVSSLAPAMLDLLREPRFAFGREDMPILWGPRGGESMRYYRAQIETALRLRGAATVDPDAALDALDGLLASIAERRIFRLDDGEMLLLDNRKALHGRTAFAPDSDRLMYRFRAHADGLA